MFFYFQYLFIRIYCFQIIICWRCVYIRCVQKISSSFSKLEIKYKVQYHFLKINIQTRNMYWESLVTELSTQWTWTRLFASHIPLITLGKYESIYPRVVNVVKSGRKWQREIDSWISFHKLLFLQRTPHTRDSDRIPILCVGRLRWISQVCFREYWLNRFCPSFSCAFPPLSLSLSLSFLPSFSLLPFLSFLPSFLPSFFPSFLPSFLPSFSKLQQRVRRSTHSKRIILSSRHRAYFMFTRSRKNLHTCKLPLAGSRSPIVKYAWDSHVCFGVPLYKPDTFVRASHAQVYCVH